MRGDPVAPYIQDEKVCFHVGFGRMSRLDLSGCVYKISRGMQDVETIAPENIVPSVLRRGRERRIGRRTSQREAHPSTQAGELVVKIQTIVGTNVDISRSPRSMGLLVSGPADDMLLPPICSSRLKLRM